MSPPHIDARSRSRRILFGPSAAGLVPLSLVASLLLACGASPKQPDVQEKESPAAAPTSSPPAPAEEPATSAAAASPDPVEASASPPAPVAAAPAAPVSERTRALLEQARASAGSGDVAGALGHLKEALADSPELPEAHYNLGIISEWMGRISTAKQHYEDALRADPEHLPSVVALARLVARAGDSAAAVALAQARLAKKPDSLALRNAVDRIRLLDRGQANQVAKSAIAILRTDEKNAEAMMNLAAANIELGRHELALAILENVKALQPQNPEVLVLQAQAHDELGEDRRARAALEAAIALPGGGSAEAHNNLGLLYHEAGDFSGAEDHFRKALLRWPDMLSAHVNLANALKGQQRFDEAVTILKRAATIAPNSAEVAYNAGILYLDGQIPEVEVITRLEQAIGYFEKYKQLSKVRTADDPVDSYIDEAKKRVEVERKRAEQLRKAAKQAPAAPAEGGTAPAEAGAPAEAAAPAGEGEQ